MEGKKGVSSVILSTLLILIVVILVVIIAMTMRTLTTSVEQATYKTQCDLENPSNIEAAEACILAKMGKDGNKTNVENKTQNEIKDIKNYISEYGYSVFVENEGVGGGVITYYQNKPNNLEIDGYIVELYQEPVLIIEQKEKEKAEKLTKEGKIIEANEILNSIDSIKNYQLEKIENEQNKLIEDLKQRVGKEKTSKDVRDFNTLKIDREYSDLINAISLDIDYIEMLKIKDSPLIKEIYPNRKIYPTLMDSVGLINANNNYQNSVSGLVLWLKGEDNANNEIGYKNGIMNGGVSFSEGRQGRGFSFDGINDYIEIPYYQSINSNEYSLSFWMKSPDELISDPYASQFTIVRLASNNKGYVFATSLSNHIRAFNLIDAGINANLDFRSGKIDGGYYTDKNWHHIVQVRNENKNILYVDGVKKYEGLRSFSDFSDSNTSLFIGGLINQYGNTGGHFKGEMDEIMLFSRAINQNEVSKLYNLENFGNKYTGAGVKVAIIDSGIDYTNPDFGGCFGEGCRVSKGWDFVNNDANPMDDNWHGTHVAGIALSNGSLKGVAPNAEIYAYKMINSAAGANVNAYLSAMERAVIDGADVISLSFAISCSGTYSSGCGPNDLFSRTADNAVDLGVSVVVAAGNSGPLNSTISSPATSRKAISVGASEKNPNVLYSASSRGPVIYNNEYMIKPDVVTPGANVCSSKLSGSGGNCFGNNYVYSGGTSMSAPFVAGSVALIKEAHPDWTPEQIKTAIKSRARNSSNPNNNFGYGWINVEESIKIKGNVLYSKINGTYNVSGIFNILGNASGEGFSNFSLYISSDNGKNWNLINQGFTQTSVLIYNFDSSNYLDGEYMLKLVVRNNLSEEFYDYSFININNIIFDNSKMPEIIKTGENLKIYGVINGSINEVNLYYRNSINGLWINTGVNVLPIVASEIGQNRLIAEIDSNYLSDGEYELNLSVHNQNIIKSELSKKFFVSSKFGGNIYLNRTYLSSYDRFGTIDINSLVIEDINADNQKEFIYVEQIPFNALRNGDSYLHVLDKNGIHLSGFPKIINYSSSAISVGDVDNDGKKDIALISGRFGSTSFNQLVVYRYDGSLIMSKFAPFNYFNYEGTMLTGSDSSQKLSFSDRPVITDLDGDGNNEIIAKFFWRANVPIGEGSNDNNYVASAIYDSSGEIINAIKLTNHYSGTFSSLDAGYSISDLNNDDIKEFIVYKLKGSYGLDRDLMVLDLNGNPLGNWQANSLTHIYKPIIVDLNNDGINDIVSSINDSSTTLKLNARNYNSNLLWSRSFSGINAPYASDLDQNNYPEINIYGNTSLSALDNNGVELYNKAITGYILANRLIGDVNGDNVSEQIISPKNYVTYQGLLAFNNNGVEIPLLSHLPKINSTNGYTFLNDLENDNNVEIMQFVSPNKFIVWSLGYKFNKSISYYPLNIRDSGNSECYDC